MRSSAIAIIAAAVASQLMLLLGCTVKEVDDPAGGGGQGPDDPPVEVSFESRLCQDGLCWLAPAPQGNQLRDAHTSPEGTTFGVGDNGAIVRWSGSAFEAMGLPADYPALLAVHALADDDVWIVGEQGTVLHLGSELVSRRPDEANETDVFIAVRAFEGGGGWLASRQGGVFRLQDGVWTRTFSATAKSQSVTLLGMWAPSAEEAWMLGRLGEEPHLYRFDGSAWSEVAITMEDPIDLVPAGAPVGITGIAAGTAHVAFDHRVVVVGADGASTNLYAVPYGGSFSPSPIVDVRADASGKTFVALESGEVLAVSEAGEETLSMTGRELGEGPDGRILLLRAAGAIGDPLAPSSPRRAIDPLLVSLGSAGYRCAPAGEGAVCLLHSAGENSQIWRFFQGEAAPVLVEDLGEWVDARLFANATGVVALAQYGTVRIFDQDGERSVSVGSDTVEDVAVSDDGTVYIATLAGDFSKVSPGASSLSNIPFSGGPSAADQSVPSLHRAGPDDIYFAAVEVVNQSQDTAVIVRSADGALLHDVVGPDLDVYPVPVITKSGVPYIGGFAKDFGDYAVFRLDGESWTQLEVPSGPNAELTAYGDYAILRNPDSDSIHLLDATGARALKLPAGALAHVVPSDAGLFGVSEHVESAMPGFSGFGGVSMFFAAVP